MRLSGDHQRAVESFLAKLRSLNPARPFAAIVVGSVVRGRETPHSDLDLLVISTDELVRSRQNRPLHVQYFTTQEFLDRMRQGDDFALWCVRFGIPWELSACWSALTESEEAKRWPEWKAKIPHALRRLLLSDDMMKLGDVEAAFEEMLYAVSHVGRAILLKEAVFPLSRPEMVGQLHERRFPQLATLLSALMTRTTDSRTLLRARRYVKKLLVHLDRGAYKAHVQMRNRLREAKRSARAVSP
jgi:hypothetical protein